MYLKRLDIQGFKSFPDKLKLEFNTGITAVVGPNGSGKSNISDAVRWVLGEQSAKSLRGAKMEDVIFAGTQNRKPLGFAEVSLTIDNGDHKMPIAFSEVTATRRVYRSGESEYLINRSPCRLKDIHELFMDTGVGKEGYSIIGQGRIDEILSTKSEDRRLLFEEAAGIVKYKNRRQEAEQKLEKEQQNLLRLEDIILELENQIEPLHQQSDRAKRYLDLREKLKLVEINIYLLEAEKIEQELCKIEEVHGNMEVQIQTEKKKQEDVKQTYQERKEAMELVEADIQRAQQELMEIRTTLERSESKVQVTKEQIQHIEQDLRRLHKDIQKKLEKTLEVENDKNIYQAKYNGLGMQIQAKQKQLEEKQSSLEAISTALSDRESKMEDFKSEIFEMLKISADRKSSLQRTATMLEQLENRNEQLTKDKKYHSSQLQDKNIRLQVLSQDQRRCEETKETIQKETDDLHLLNLQVQKEISEKKHIMDRQTQSLNDARSRYRVLSEMEKEHEGFYKSVKSILKLKESQPAQWEGICGVVGELLVVPKAYEIAIEIALGANLQNIITQTEEDAKQAIGYLKKNHLGRATFLPLSAIKGKSLGQEKEALLKEKGVVGIASELIQYNTLYDQVMTNLLGRVIIMDNLDAAVVLAKKYRHAYRLVTLEGDIINPGGALTGGSLSQKTTNIFGRSRELEELKTSMESIHRSIQAQNEEIRKLEEKKAENEAVLEEKHKQIQAIHMEDVSIHHQIDQTKQSIAELEEKYRYLEVEQQQLYEQKEETRQVIGEQTQILHEVEQQLAAVQGQLDKFQSTMQSERISKEDLMNEITNIKIHLSSLEQEQKSLQDQMRRFEKEERQIVEEMEAEQAEIQRLEMDKTSKIAYIQNVQQEIQQTLNQQEQKQKDLIAQEKSRKEHMEKINEQDVTLQELLEQIGRMQNELYRIETKKERLANEQDILANTIWEAYEVTSQSAKQYETLNLPLGQLEKQCGQYKGEMKALGNINLDAIEQYKEVKERYEFLSAQKKDILEAEGKLRQIIKELTESMEIQFAAQFALISSNFNEVFGELFGGGQAYLQLADEQNVLESGIDIIAQPPGKRLQNMMLLSGGERALTAIALLFAILKIKPSPFCILDEIEAALDDANVNRYAAYLKKFAQDTQFIVVTHRKGTMEAADALYGVTMQEQGVSKLVSVKFSEAEEAVI